MKNTNPYPTFKQILVLICVYFISMIITAIITLPIGEFLLENSQHPFLLALIAIVPMICIIWYALKKRGTTKLKWKFQTNSNIGILLATLVLSISSALLIEPVLELLPNVEALRASLDEAFTPTFLTFFLAVIFAPIAEEVLFRGIILEGFAKRYGATKAILGSSLLFGLIHVQPLQVVGAFFGGLFMGWVYLRTRSLIPVIFLHLVNNLMSFVLLVGLGTNNYTTWELVGSNTLYIGVLIGAVALTAIAIHFIKKNTKGISSIEDTKEEILISATT